MQKILHDESPLYGVLRTGDLKRALDIVRRYDFFPRERNFVEIDDYHYELWVQRHGMPAEKIFTLIPVPLENKSYSEEELLALVGDSEQILENAIQEIEMSDILVGIAEMKGFAFIKGIDERFSSPRDMAKELGNYFYPLM